MTRAHQPLAWLLQGVVGLVFLVSALIKALDLGPFKLQIAFFGVADRAEWITPIAIGLILLEAVIGAALLTGLWLRGAAIALAAVLLAGFSALLYYGWRHLGLEDCGCFGRYLRMAPPVSIGKNAAMLALLGSAVLLWRRAPRGPLLQDLRFLATWPPRLAPLILAFGAIGIGMVFGQGSKPYDPRAEQLGAVNPIPEGQPFAQFQFEIEGVEWNLGEGEYLVALLDVTCTGCRAAAGVLNRFLRMDDMPWIIGLCGNTPEMIEIYRPMFQVQPMFPLVSIGEENYLALTGDQIPRIVLIRDGDALRVWDARVPRSDDIRKTLVESRRATIQGNSE